MNTIKVASALLLATLPALAQHNGNSHKFGTDILHYSVREAFTAEDGATIQGQAYLSFKEQGKAKKQTADITLRQLDPNSPYLLFASLGDTNDPKYVTSFDASGKGRATLRFRVQGNGKGLGKGKLPLPGMMDPTTTLKELTLCNASTQVVARAEFDTPDKLSYLVKRNLSTQDLESILRLYANQRSARLKWVVSGLAPSTEYLLELNGTVVESVTSDADGKLIIDRKFEDPYEALGLESIYIDDLTTTNNIVGTKLP